MNSSTGVLTVNLGAIQDNWRYVSSLLARGTSCAAVVKANAYGVGAIPVATALYTEGCRHFFVVTLHEALDLRAALPANSAIYVLGGVRAGSEETFAHQNLIPVLYSVELIARWALFCEQNKKYFPCVIKIDTGMCRLGLSLADFSVFTENLAAFPYLKPILLMSHLACADEPAHALNEKQLNNFNNALIKIRHYFPEIKGSLANSSGTFLGEKYHFDMVRIGAALYGINPQPTQQNPLASAINLMLPVLQLRTLSESSSVGYGAEFAASSDSRLAVVAGGYADGINRSLGVKPKGRIGNDVVEAIGRISMDSCIFDIAESENHNPTHISVIDDYFTLDKLSRDNKLLGYEVLTSLGRRFKREYIQGKTENE